MYVNASPCGSFLGISEDADQDCPDIRQSRSFVNGHPNLGKEREVPEFPFQAGN